MKGTLSDEEMFESLLRLFEEQSEDVLAGDSDGT